MPRRPLSKKNEGAGADAASISTVEVGKMAKLAHLSLNSREEESYSRELSAIIRYFRIIDGAELSNVAPTYHATELTNVFRGEDVVATDPDPILNGVPKKKGRLVWAPRVY